jgi:nucleoside-diphosphate-sugar epimerase
MRIFVTGATGFVGSFLLEKLISENHELAILCRIDGDFWRIEQLKNCCKVIYCDYKSINLIENELIQFDPEVVYHIGWLGVSSDQRNNENQLTDNIQATLGLVQVLTKTKVKHVIALGSQAEYGPYNNAINENFLTKPTTIYGIAKLSAYHILNHHLNSFGIRFSWLRLFSSYGPKDNPNWLIPYLITSLSKGEKPLLTKGEQVWDYIYIASIC